MKPLDLSVRLVVTQTHDTFVLRAIVREHPGGAPDLILQRIDNGDEAEPWTLAREVVVDHKALNAIDRAEWTEDGLEFLEGDKTWFVRASPDHFETKAIKND